MLERGSGTALAGGRYRLDRVLGRGGMASVWLGWDTSLEREVAIKVMSDVLAADPAYLTRFEREAKVAAGLSHPNLVQVYDYFAATGESPYLVMEYIDGGTLGDRRDADVATLARQLLDALAHVHKAGIVHRDVKPANVLIGERDRRARLTDFGIAQPEDATSLTETGQVVGTRRYMAPEVQAGEPASPGSDLYSCGVLLGEQLGQAGQGRLGRLVDDLRAPDPGRRPGSADAALERLEPRSLTAPTMTFETAKLEPATPEMARTPLSPTATGDRRESRLDVGPRAALGVLAAAAALLVAVLAFSGGDDEPDQPRGDEQAGPAAADPGDGTDGVTPSAGAEAVEGGAQGDDPAQGAQLNQEGYRLVQEGKYGDAIPILRRAVAAFPEGTRDLSYAYALFNLGQALRLSGDPEAAIPILEQRLKIDNQTETVRAELDAARRAAGAGGPKAGKKAKDR